MSTSHENTSEDMVALLSRTISKLYSLWITKTYPFAAIGKGVWMHHSSEVSRSAASYIRIGNSVYLERGASLSIPVTPDRDEPVIILEDGCKISRRTTILAKNRVHIGRDTIFGPSVLVADHNLAFEDVSLPISRQGTTSGGTIRIEEGCWIGLGAVIVCEHGELVIGRNSVVGANSVITRSVPPYSVVVGNTMRIAKQYDPSTGQWETVSHHSDGIDAPRTDDDARPASRSFRERCGARGD